MNLYQRRIPFSSTRNTRDLGGYPAAGGFTRWGRIYRSDAPLSFSDEDVALLRRLDIRTAIDLRTAEQAAAEPSALSLVEGVAYRRCSFPAGNHAPSRQEEMPDTYMELLSCRENVGRVLRLIAAADGPVIFHCQVGKDRTGLIAALLLLLAGVEEADVLADYQVSATYILPILMELRRRDPTIPSWAGRSDPECLREVLGRLRAEYGGVSDYLAACGLIGSEMDELRARLVWKGEKR